MKDLAIHVALSMSSEGASGSDAKVELLDVHTLVTPDLFNKQCVPPAMVLKRGVGRGLRGHREPQPGEALRVQVRRVDLLPEAHGVYRHYLTLYSVNKTRFDAI